MQVFRAVSGSLLGLLLFISAPAFALQAGTGPDTSALVRRATKNELAASAAVPLFRFRIRKADDRGIATKEVIQTKDGSVSKLIALADKPLTAEQANLEMDRLSRLLDDPSSQARRQKREREDSARATKMVRLLPDAFLYTNLGMAEGRNGPCYRLAFQPNPNFQPPDREAQVYHGMAGELWIDKGQERLVKLDAHLMNDVDFGWGILGRLYKGGALIIEQSDIGGHHWQTTHLKLNISGKALMVKSLHVNTTEDTYDYQPVSQMGYKEAIKLLQTDKAQFAHK